MKKTKWEEIVKELAIFLWGKYVDPDAEKMALKMIPFFKAKFDQRETNELAFLERVKLELDVCVCECGEKWKETDLADLVSGRLKTLNRKRRGK